MSDRKSKSQGDNLNTFSCQIKVKNSRRKRFITAKRSVTVEDNDERKQKLKLERKRKQAGIKSSQLSIVILSEYCKSGSLAPIPTSCKGSVLATKCEGKRCYVFCTSGRVNKKI